MGSMQFAFRLYENSYAYIENISANISIGYWWTLLFPCIFMIILVLLLNGISGIIKEIINDKS